MKLATNRFDVRGSQPVLISYSAVLCSGIAGMVIGLSSMDSTGSLPLFLGNLALLVFCSIAMRWRRLYFLSIAGIVAALFSLFFMALITGSIFTYYLFRNVAEGVQSAQFSSDEEEENPRTGQLQRRDRQVYDTPMYCVFCGEKFFDDEEKVGLYLSSCPACKHSIPQRFRPVVPRVDASMRYCIRCGHFLERRDFITMACSACHARMPET